ncbi:hypothetical protein [Clostridium sporogenes]|nr:hypothetical protein [Clostridium sporogenes]
MVKVIDVEKTCKELLDVLAKNEIPVDLLDSLYDELKKLAYSKTIIQK